MAEKSLINNMIHASEARRMKLEARTWRLLAFYLGVPVIVALYGGLNNWQLLEMAGYGPALGFYAAHAILPWWTTCALTSLAMWTLARWKPSPYVLMLIGSLAAALVTLPYTNWLTAAWDTRWPSAQLHQQIAPLFSAEFWRYTASATAMWLIVNFIFDRFLGLPRYRYVIPRGYDFHVPTPSAQPAPATSDKAVANGQPGFTRRMPVDLGLGDILAIKAEQHYIRVYTADREYLLRELGPDIGVQVHRSYWINKNAIDCIKPRAKKFLVKLVTGTEIPVSTPYHAMVKDIARSRGLRERP
jgi:hypothetical protein